MIAPLLLLLLTFLSCALAKRVVYVTNTLELGSAITLVQPGDEIIVASGNYFSPTSQSSFLEDAFLTSSVAGKASKRIVLRGEDPNDPPVIFGTDVSYWSVLRLRGGAHYWTIQDLHFTNAEKGIVVDASDNVEIKRVSVFKTGEEAIHIRSASKNALIEDVTISDTGLVTAGFGEGIYVGSDKSVWTFFPPEVSGTVIRRASIGPDVRAEPIDIREGATDTTIEYCTINTAGLSGGNFADSFIDIKGSRTFVRFNEFYRNGAAALTKGVAIIDREVVNSGSQNVIHDNLFDFDGDSSMPMVQAGSRTEETIVVDNVKLPSGGTQTAGGPILTTCCPSWYDRPAGTGGVTTGRPTENPPTNPPTSTPTNAPTNSPTNPPTNPPTNAPTHSPTNAPTNVPTIPPTNPLTNPPTNPPTSAPTSPPTNPPTSAPTSPPSSPPTIPTSAPTSPPSSPPTNPPTSSPTSPPTSPPTNLPTDPPTPFPTTPPQPDPTPPPSPSPTPIPTVEPTPHPTTRKPSVERTPNPTRPPSLAQTAPATVPPTTIANSKEPTRSPTLRPTAQASLRPSTSISPRPSASPSNRPSIQRSDVPSPSPSSRPTLVTSFRPSDGPSVNPTPLPSSGATVAPTARPTTLAPSEELTLISTGRPTGQASLRPSHSISPKPSASPSNRPSIQRSEIPSPTPSDQPTLVISSSPTGELSVEPSRAPVLAPATPAPVTEAPATPVTSVTSAPTDAPVAEAPVAQPLVSQSPVSQVPVTLSPVARQTGSPITQAPATTAPVIEAPVWSVGDFCDDSDFDEFIVPSTNESHRCVWLAARPEYYDEVCTSETGVKACPELCGACFDNCTDTNTKFLHGESIRDCVWLSLRPESKPEFCAPGSNASIYCGETCDVCDTPRKTAAPFVAPTPPPILPGYLCDDDKYQTFPVEPGRNETCIWLAARPENRTLFCQPNHTSGAYDVCEETCAKCADDCDDTSGTFDVITGEGDVSVRDCLWLSLRPKKQELLCVPGSTVMSVCPESCDVCDGDGTQGPSATPPPAPLGPYCDDSMLGTFFVKDLDEYQRCVWLEARAEWQEILCKEGHPSNARIICPETCGVCQDDCVDLPHKFNVEEGDGARHERDCLWLSLRPALNEVLCARRDVSFICAETCNTCDAAV